MINTALHITFKNFNLKNKTFYKAYHFRLSSNHIIKSYQSTIWFSAPLYLSIGVFTPYELSAKFHRAAQILI